MYTNYIYYVVDKVSETILGSFFSKSDDMASRIMKNFDYDKANLSPDDIEVYRDPVKSSIYETYDEIMNGIGKKANLFDHQQLFLGSKEDEK